MAMLIVLIWGVNFIFIQMALVDIPPLTLAALRFFLVGLPAVFFIPRPRIPFRSLLQYGLLMFAVQFSFLFLGMRLGVSAGLTSMLMQTQVFFTMGMAVLIFKERLSFLKIFGALVAFAGVVMVGLHSGRDFSFLGFVLILCASLSWATGNILVKTMAHTNALALVTWGGLVAFPPLTLMAAIFEGPEMLTWVQRDLHPMTFVAVAYIVYLSTHTAYSLWGRMLRFYSASTVVPFTLLIPIFGFLSSAWVLGEEIQNWKILAGVLVISGLALNLYKPEPKNSAGAKNPRDSF